MAVTPENGGNRGVHRLDVTNLENGKSITLTVNDRGPFAPGRVLDLSYAAAKSLGMLDKGLARVLIRTSGRVQDQKNNDMIGSFFVHIGSFDSEADAKYLIEDMKSIKYKASTIKVIRADRDGAKSAGGSSSDPTSPCLPPTGPIPKPSRIILPPLSLQPSRS